MKVLQVLPSLAARVGGPAFSVTALAHGLQDVGVSVSIFATDLATPGGAPDAKGNVTFEELPVGAAGLDIKLFPVSRPYRFAYSPALRAALREEVRHFDVVHINSVFSYPQFAAFSEAARQGVPHVVSTRGALDPLLRKRGRVQKTVANLLWVRRMLNTAGAICYTAPDEMRLVADLNFAAPGCVIPNVVNTALYNEALPDVALRSKLTGGSGNLILCHGRLSWKKRLDLLVDALSVLRNQGVDVHLGLIGPDDEGIGNRLTEQARSLGVQDRLHLLGMLHGQALASVVRAADVWVLPSHSENFGVAVIEAMAAGRPVVVSRHVNIGSEIADNDAGIIIDPTPSEIARSVSFLISEPGVAEGLGSRARSFVRRYEGQTVASEMLKVYEEVLSRHGNGLPKKVEAA